MQTSWCLEYEHLRHQVLSSCTGEVAPLGHLLPFHSHFPFLLPLDPPTSLKTIFSLYFGPLSKLWQHGRNDLRDGGWRLVDLFCFQGLEGWRLVTPTYHARFWGVADASRFVETSKLTYTFISHCMVHLWTIGPGVVWVRSIVPNCFTRPSL